MPDKLRGGHDHHAKGHTHGSGLHGDHGSDDANSKVQFQNRCQIIKIAKERSKLSIKIDIIDKFKKLYKSTKL